MGKSNNNDTKQRRAALMAALLALLILGLYCSVTGYGFIEYDDPDFLTANPHVQAGLNWESVTWAFGNTTQAAYWAPVMWLSHIVAWQLFGPNAWGHHLTNVLFHATNAALAFLVLRRLTRSTWRSLLVAVLFGVHPLRVESVAWVTERKDVLSLFFWLLAVWAYANYAQARQRRRPWYFAALVLFALGLMSKPMVVTLPGVLLLLDYWPLARFPRVGPRRLLLEKTPFFALSVGTAVLTVLVQARAGVVAAQGELPLAARIANALVSYGLYLRNTLWPTNLAVFYPRSEQWPVAAVLAAGLGFLSLSLWVWQWRRKSPAVLVGWLWFVTTLVPVIGLVQSSDQAMADRFTYIPFVGLLVMIVWGLDELRRRWRCGATGAALAAAVTCLMCALLTRQQLTFWQDSETLFRHAAMVTRGNYIAQAGIAAAAAKKGQVEEAIRLYRESIQAKPQFTDGHYNLALMLAKSGQLDEAIAEYQESIGLKPNSPDAHYNLGNALLRKGQLDQAISQYEEVLRLNPKFALAHNNLGNALLRKGRLEPAIEHYRQAIQLQPDYALAYQNLGNALLQTGDTNGAAAQFREALRLRPEGP